MMTIEAHKGNQPDMSQHHPEGTELLILRVEDRLTLGMPGIRAGGIVFFDAETRIEPEIPIHWQDTPLFHGPIILGEPMQIRDDVAPGFYRFGIAGHTDHPFGIGVDEGGRPASAYLVYEDITGYLNLKVFAFVSQDHPVVTFRAECELEQEIEIMLISSEESVCTLSPNKRLANWRIDPDRLGRMSVLVRLKDARIDQMGGGEEAEVEIVPPDSVPFL